LDKFETVDKARKILGLGEEADREEVKNKYKDLMKKYHPDKTSPDNKEYLEKAKMVNWAYQIITSYCDEYRFSFCREEVERMNPDLKLNKQFEDDWLSK